MNSVWRSLLWKEWREHRGKLAVLTAIFVLVPVVPSLRHPDAIFGIMSPLLFIAIPLASMFVAMNIAAGEQARGTINFLQSLPISMTRPAGAKLLLGAVTVVAPVLLAVAVAALWSWLLSPGEAAEAIQFDLDVYKTSWLIDNWYVARAVGGSLAAVSIFLWLAAAGVNRSDEVRAAAVGLLAVVAFWAGIVYLGYAVRTGDDLPYWWYVLTAGAAGGPALSQPGLVAAAGARSAGPVAALWPFAVVAVCSHVVLVTWFIFRFGRKAPGRTPQVEPASAVHERAWLAPPRRRPWTAILWKQARISAPLGGMMAIAIFFTAVIFACYADWRREGEAMSILVAAAFGAWAAMGLFVAFPAGIAVFMEDLDPRLHAFWRSRPVNVDQWFVVKFFTGLLIPMLILPLPMLASIVLALLAGKELPPDSGEAVRTGAGFLIAHVGLYCTSVLMMILVRQAAYASILTVAAAGAFFAALELLVPWISGAGAALAGIGATVAVAVLAWTALRNDWGWSL